MLILLFILNLAAYPALFLFGPLYFTRYFRLGPFNPVLVVAVALLPITLITYFTGPAVVLPDGLFNPYFQYALLVSNTHTLLNTFVLIFLVRLFGRNRGLARVAERFATALGPARPARMRLAAAIFFGLFVVFFVLLAQHSFSVLQWIADPRIGYQLHRTGAGQWFALAINALSVSLVLATVYARSSLIVLLLAPFYLLVVYVLGSKGFIVNFAEYLIVILAIRQFRRLRPVVLFTAVAVAALVITNFVSAVGNLSLEQLAGYSDGYTNAALYYQKYLNGDLPLYQGQIFTSNFWALVPRSLYPDKPYVYGTTIIVEVFYPGIVEQTNTPSFATVDYFADLGWLGVVLNAVLLPSNVLLAFLYALVLPRLSQLNWKAVPQAFDVPQAFAGTAHSRSLLYAFLLLAAPALLVFFEFPGNAVLFAVIIGLIEVINRLRFFSPERAAQVRANG